MMSGCTDSRRPHFGSGPSTPRAFPRLAHRTNAAKQHYNPTRTGPPQRPSKPDIPPDHRWRNPDEKPDSCRFRSSEPGYGHRSGSKRCQHHRRRCAGNADAADRLLLPVSRAFVGRGRPSQRRPRAAPRCFTWRQRSGIPADLGFFRRNRD